MTQPPLTPETMDDAALYVGDVMHARTRPRRHALRYRMYALLLDLDRLDAINARLRLFSVGGFNLFSFHTKDRGDGSGRDLAAQVRGHLDAAGIDHGNGPIRLLTMPRLLGWAFNPLSVYFCHGADGTLQAVLWEVDNTFGQRHAYLIPVTGESDGQIEQHCDKAFYVSPFMDMGLHYTFRFHAPADTTDITIDVSDSEGLMLRAHQKMARAALSDRTLLKLFFSLPFLTLRVVGGIHWEALKIWLKGVRLRPRPAPPTHPVSVIEPATPPPAPAIIAQGQLP